MQPYSIKVDDDWNAEARHASIKMILTSSYSWNFDTIKASLISASSYDITTGHDTVWSVIEDMNAGKGYLSEGNPSRDDFQIVNL